MKEIKLINIIKEFTENKFIGDDCAYLKDLGIVVTQDNFVENIHFKTDWATPYQIGYKATIVNISDIIASGATPKYLSIGLSLPTPDEDFVKNFYKGVVTASNGAKIIGGDITKAEKIFISITAIGTTNSRNISSRSHAQEGYIVIASSEHGKSSLGLKELMKNGNNIDLIKAHLEPNLDVEFSEILATKTTERYAMMDSSDGLADALFKIATASNVKICAQNTKGMFGSEDYKLVAAVSPNVLSKLNNYIYIGSVEKYDGIRLKIGEKIFNSYSDLNLYSHF